MLDCDGESLVSCGVDGLVIVWKVGFGFSFDDIYQGGLLDI